MAIFIFLLKEYDGQEKILIPVGTAITIVAAVKYALVSTSSCVGISARNRATASWRMRDGRHELEKIDDNEHQAPVRRHIE